MLMSHDRFKKKENVLLEVDFLQSEEFHKKKQPFTPKYKKKSKNQNWSIKENNFFELALAQMIFFHFMKVFCFLFLVLNF